MSLDALIAPLTLLAGLLLGAAWELEQRARPPRPPHPTRPRARK